MGEVHVCKIPLENITNDLVTIYSLWDSSSFSLKILHNADAWEKNISSDSVESMSHFTQYKPSEYILETKRALATNEGAKDFTYTLIDSEFTWKKVVDKDQNIKVKFGALRLEKASISSIIQTITDFLIRQGISAENKTNYLENENTNLKMVNSSLRAQVDNLVSSKKEMEENLYKKIILLLNAKKEKILELEKNIEELKKAPPGKPSKSIQSTKKISEDKRSDPYGSETEIDSDEEKLVLCSSSKSEQRDECGSETDMDTDEENFGPSTSKPTK